MNNIRKVTLQDIPRIAEIEVFNYRLNFYPIFKNDAFYFDEFQVVNKMEEYENNKDFLEYTYVYDDGVVKGFVRVDDSEIKKLFVEPVLQGEGIGARLLEYAMEEKKAGCLWALEKNVRAISFYEKHGFKVTENRKFEEGTTEYLVKLKRK